MRLTQADVAHLSDAQVRALAVAMRQAAGEVADPVNSVWWAFAAALVGALRERRRVLAVAELDLADDEEEGGLVGAGDDPIGEAVGRLRAGPGAAGHTTGEASGWGL